MPSQLKQAKHIREFSGLPLQVRLGYYEHVSTILLHLPPIGRTRAPFLLGVS